MRFAKAVVKHRIPILILTVILMIPSVIGMINTRVNYDMLTYLPSDMETVIGQNELLKDFDKGAFTFLIFEDMPNKDVAKLKEKIEAIDHVDTVLWYDSLADLSIPMELLPDSVFKEFNSDHSTMMAVFFDTGTSDELTMDAVEKIRSVSRMNPLRVDPSVRVSKYSWSRSFSSSSLVRGSFAAIVSLSPTVLMTKAWPS